MAGCDDSPATGDADSPSDLAVPELTSPADLRNRDLPLPPDGIPSGIEKRPANPTCLAPARPVDNPALALAPAFPGVAFTLPILLLQSPGDGTRFYLVQKGGVVKRFANDPNVKTTADFVNITARVNSGPNEAGLLGMAFPPGFAQNGFAYLSCTGFGGPVNLRSTFSRFTSKDGGLTLDPASEVKLLTLDQPYANHNGGHVAFGNDGFLYIGVGDGGSAGDPQKNGQNSNVWLGKILRLDVDGGSPYKIPPDNPFAQGGGKPEIYALGLRNPWRFSFDRTTGDLWAGDVGQSKIEEVDKIVLGGNYGWNIKEGAACYAQGPCKVPGLIEPIVQYTHAAGISVTGGHVYRGAAIPSLAGKYLFADFGSGRIWAVVNDKVTGKAAPQLLLSSGRSISSFGEGDDKELYLLDYGPGTIHKLVPGGNPAPDPFPKTLSATGCFDKSDPRKPAPGLIPYDVNVPLWSDRATKERFMALPDGGKTHVNADGDWDFPDRTVRAKTFLLAGKRIETRLFMRHDDGAWAGYTYEWNDAETDAVLLPAGKSKAIGAQTWYFPTRAECLACHTDAAGRTLGLETGQLNGEFTYPGGTWNQVATLAYIGLFDAPPPQLLPHDPPAGSNASAESRARGYLHANCGNCHRPGGTGQGPADFRFGIALANTGACGVAPTGAPSASRGPGPSPPAIRENRSSPCA